jgi:hypothetical protein
MTPCKACGRLVRKSVLAHLLTAGGLRGARVCQACAVGGVLIVACRVAPVVDTAKAERRDQGAVLEPFVRNIDSKIRAMQAARASDDFTQGRLEAYEGIAAMLREGRA